jgi:hypothetical protein
LLESSRVAGVAFSPECGFELGRRDIAKRLQKPAVVEPVHPLQGGVLDLVELLPGPRRRMSSVLNSPMMVSARALS